MPIFANTWELRRGNSASDGTQGHDKHFVRTFMVKTYGVYAFGKGAQQVLLNPLLPAKGSAFDNSDPSVVCIHRHAELNEEKNATLYRVTCYYGVDTTAAGSIGTGQPPWNRPSIPTWSTKDFERVLDKDYSATPKAIVNCVGDPPDPPIMTRVVSPVAIIHSPRRMSDLDYVGQIAPLVNTVNIAAVNIYGQTFAAGRCKLLEAPAAPTSYTDGNGTATQYWDLTLHIEISNLAAGFNSQPRLNTGYRAYKTASTPPATGIAVPAYDSTGAQQGFTAPSRPVVLTANGKVWDGVTPLIAADYFTCVEFLPADWTPLRLA